MNFVRPTESGDVRLQTPPEAGFQVMSGVRPVESRMSVSDMLSIFTLLVSHGAERVK